MKKLTFLASLIFVLVASNALATTYYVANNPSGKAGWGNGSNSNNGTNKTTPFLTIGKAQSVMSGGDTLIICDGLYIGSVNMSDGDSNQRFPAGTSNAYTTVMAETDGAVTIDGEGVRAPLYIHGNGAVESAPSPSSVVQQYMVFRGLVLANSNGQYQGNCLSIYASDHIKIINCGAVDPYSGNTSGFNAAYSNYILFEGCYAWGAGRYKFSFFHTDHSIMRNCFSRNDWCDAQNTGPNADFTVYSSTFCEVQNCIAIDGDDSSKWLNVQSGAYAGAFNCPTTSNRVDGIYGSINITNSIAINLATQFMTSANNTYPADVHFSNCTGWGLTTVGSLSFANIRGYGYFDKCTFGNINNSAGNLGQYGIYWYADGSSPVAVSITNCIMHLFQNANYMFKFQNGGAQTIDHINVDQGPATLVLSGPTITNLTTASSLTSGLLYPIRIESSSVLSTAGSSGGVLGATITKQYGKSGTLWGETGYNLLQDGTNGQSDVNLWPFPNEDLIKIKMAAYSANSVNGARGFCAGTSKDGSAQTLTKYIWEYLGNQIPSDIYGGSGTVHSTLKGGSTTGSLK